MARRKLGGRSLFSAACAAAYFRAERLWRTSDDSAAPRVVDLRQHIT
jgi:hypothetical protein